VRDRRAEAGITLIEVLVAVVVITVGVLALGAVIPTGIHRVTDSESETRASALGSERSEQLLITPYDHEDLDAGAHADDANPHDGLFNVLWNVEVDQPVTDCKRVTVTVQRASNNRVLSKLVIVIPRSNG
jgi:type IV pilus modification protein PilV